MHALKVFVTGGQTGADSIPLQFPYKKHNIGVKGYMPKGFKRFDGKGEEVAKAHGLVEGEGNYEWRDQANAAMADACLAFLTVKPRTGMGTTKTFTVFTDGKYEYIPVDKPSDADFKVIAPKDEKRRPVMIVWDITKEKIPELGKQLKAFLNTHKPKSLMFSGGREDTIPGVTELGVQLLLEAMRETKGPSFPSAVLHIPEFKEDSLKYVQLTPTLPRDGSHAVVVQGARYGGQWIRVRKPIASKDLTTCLEKCEAVKSGAVYVAMPQRLVTTEYVGLSP